MHRKVEAESESGVANTTNGRPASLGTIRLCELDVGWDTCAEVSRSLCARTAHALRRLDVRSEDDMNSTNLASSSGK